MNETLYARFSSVVRSFSGIDLPDAIDGTEAVIRRAHGELRSDVPFPTRIETGHPADRLLRVFDRYSVGDAVAVVVRLRGELADELARSGASTDEVREVREGGPSAG